MSGEPARGVFDAPEMDAFQQRPFFRDIGRSDQQFVDDDGAQHKRRKLLLMGNPEEFSGVDQIDHLEK